MQLTKKLQSFTETQRKVQKLMAKELIKMDHELKICQEHRSFMNTQIGFSSSLDEASNAHSTLDSALKTFELCWGCILDSLRIWLLTMHIIYFCFVLLWGYIH